MIDRLPPDRRIGLTIVVGRGAEKWVVSTACVEVLPQRKDLRLVEDLETVYDWLVWATPVTRRTEAEALAEHERTCSVVRPQVGPEPEWLQGFLDERRRGRVEQTRVGEADDPS